MDTLRKHWTLEHLIRLVCLSTCVSMSFSDCPLLSRTLSSHIYRRAAQRESKQKNLTCGCSCKWERTNQRGEKHIDSWWPQQLRASMVTSRAVSFASQVAAGVITVAGAPPVAVVQFIIVMDFDCVRCAFLWIIRCWIAIFILFFRTLKPVACHWWLIWGRAIEGRKVAEIKNLNALHWTWYAVRFCACSVVLVAIDCPFEPTMACT